MSIAHCRNYEQDREYYIDKNYDLTSLERISSGITEAIADLRILEAAVAAQYAKATQAVDYKRVIARKDQNKYSSDKKIYITVYLDTYKMLDGTEVKHNMIYNTNKQFSYKKIDQAAAYAIELMASHGTKEYLNNTGYKKMEVFNAY